MTDLPQLATHPVCQVALDLLKRERAILTDGKNPLVQALMRAVSELDCPAGLRQRVWEMWNDSAEDVASLLVGDWQRLERETEENAGMGWAPLRDQLDELEGALLEQPTDEEKGYLFLENLLNALELSEPSFDPQAG